MLSASLYGDFGLVANLTNEGITAYKKRRDKLSDGDALFYSSPKDSDIIEIPRLSEKEWGEHCKLIKHILNHFKISKEEKILPKLVSGYDIMNVLSNQSGPIIGVILKRIEEAQLNEDIKTREEALNIIKNKNNSGDVIAKTL